MKIGIAIIILELILTFPIMGSFAEERIELGRLPVSEDKETIELEGKISAYNVGVEWQNDDTPCVGASNINLCPLVDKGQLVIANRHYFGKYACIEGIGCGQILDKMNARYSKEYFDIAMPQDKVKEARQFGRQNLKVIIYK